jgi:hypothetical protein
MSETRGGRSADPRLLLEAARVFNAAGPDYKSISEVVAESALQVSEKAEPRVREAIIGDAVALRLSGRVAGGYHAALELLREIEQDSDGRLHLLRALANGQKYKAMRLTGKSKDAPELVDLRQQIREDLQVAFSKNDRLKLANQRFWQPASAALAAGDREDDLSDVYNDDVDFQILVDPLRSLTFVNTESATRISAWVYPAGKIDQTNYDKLQEWLDKQPEDFLKGKGYPPAAFLSGDTPEGNLELIRRRALEDLKIPK